MPETYPLHLGIEIPALDWMARVTGSPFHRIMVGAEINCASRSCIRYRAPARSVATWSITDGHRGTNSNRFAESSLVVALGGVCNRDRICVFRTRVLACIWSFNSWMDVRRRSRIHTHFVSKIQRSIWWLPTTGDLGGTLYDYLLANFSFNSAQRPSEATRINTFRYNRWPRFWRSWKSETSRADHS